MKNKYIALIIAMLTTITAHAGDTEKVVLASTNEPIEFNIEPHWTGMYQRTKSDGQWGQYQWNNTEQFSVGADFKNGWDLEAETGVSRNTGPDQQTGGYTELKLRYTWELSKDWAFSLRGGLGDEYSYTGPSAPNVGYWLAQVKLERKLSERWSTFVRYDPGSLLNGQYGDTFVNTFKFGLTYKVSKNVELGGRYITAFGQNYQGNGIETTLGYSF